MKDEMKENHMQSCFNISAVMEKPRTKCLSPTFKQT